MKVYTLDAGVLPSPLKTPMEDRKRAIAADHEDGGPPNKRQATTANGASIKLDADKEKEIENYQKDAILRQMREYKRERNYLESQVNELTKRATHHDDNIRLIDSWFIQTLDEIHATIKELPIIDKESEPFQSSLLAENGTIWEEHLQSRSVKIREFVGDLHARAPPASPEVQTLQEKIVALLAAEKAHIVEVQRISTEKDQLQEKLETAMYRYLIAEKKLDRHKSAAVQKLEQQAIAKREDDSGKTAAADKVVKSEKPETNGDFEPVANAATESARREAVAAAEKRKLQVDQLEVENKRLIEELTSSKTRAATVTDDDFAKTGLFSTTKSQMDDMIKRINDLKATNTQLQEEAKRLQAERMSFRSQMEEESRAAVNENEGQLARSESDLARIRGLRDDLAAEVAILKGGDQGGSEQSIEAVKELANAREARITALESELEQLRLKYGETQPPSSTDLDSLSAEDLKTKVQSLDSQFQMLSTELPAMESAWRKASALASKKIADMTNYDDQVSKLGAEKAKADQKYFAAMKTKEAREAELRMVKMQNSKTSEIVSQLKEAEQAARLLAAGLEKQVSEAKEGLTRLEGMNRGLQQKVSEGEIASQTLKTEVSELKKLVSGKDEAVTKVGSERRKIEVELAECKTRLEDAKKQVEQMRKRTAKGDAAEADDWRRVAICPVCNSNLRNTALKLCSHVFCNNCVQDLISHRSRKCPSCGKAFGVNDSMPIILT